MRPAAGPVLSEVALSDVEVAALQAVVEDPVLFARVFLGFEPWSKQADIMRAVAEHDRVAVSSGHKIGKSILAAAIAIWFCVTRPGARVILTAAIARQVEKIIWREVRAMHQRAEKRGTPIGGKLALLPAKGLSFPDGRELFGFATNEKENMAGFSAPHMLYVVDEASGVPDEMYEAIEGNRAGGAKILMLSNPTQPSGEFFNAFHSKRALYRTFQVSSEDSPNVVSGQRLVPGLATREYIEEKRIEWGPDYENHPLYLVRIKGRFAAQASNALISLNNLLQGIANAEVDDETDADAPLRVGFDVARYGGDKNVLAPRRGRRLPRLPLVVAPGDGAHLAQIAVDHVHRWMTPYERANPQTVALFVDANGVGWSPVDHLKRHPHRDFRLVPVQTGESSKVLGEKGVPKYLNLRAELWFSMAAWSEFCILPDGDGELQAELIDVRYQLTDKMRLKIESKDDIKARLGRSPDKSDAVALTFAPDAVFRLPTRRERADDVLASL